MAANSNAAAQIPLGTIGRPATLVSVSHSVPPNVSKPAQGPRRKWLCLDAWTSGAGIWASLVTIVGFGLAIVVYIWTRKSYKLATWTALKDYRDDCRSQNATYSYLPEACLEALSRPLPAPSAVLDKLYKRMSANVYQAVSDGILGIQGWVHADETTLLNGRGPGFSVTRFSNLECQFLFSACVLFMLDYKPHVAYRCGTLRQDITRQLKSFGLYILAPDLLLHGAIGDYRRARQLKKIMRYAGYANRTLTHSFCANMGGYVVVDEDGNKVTYDLSNDTIRRGLDTCQIPGTDLFLGDWCLYAAKNVSLAVFLPYWLLYLYIMFADTMLYFPLKVAVMGHTTFRIYAQLLWLLSKSTEFHPIHTLPWSQNSSDRLPALKKLKELKKRKSYPKEDFLWILPCLSIAYSSVYVLYWNLFGTRIEQALWRTSIILPAGIAVLTTMYLWSGMRLEQYLPGDDRCAKRPLAVILLVLCGLCRAFIVWHLFTCDLIR